MGISYLSLQDQGLLGHRMRMLSTGSVVEPERTSVRAAFPLSLVPWAGQD